MTDSDVNMVSSDTEKEQKALRDILAQLSVSRSLDNSNAAPSTAQQPRTLSQMLQAVTTRVQALEKNKEGLVMSPGAPPEPAPPDGQRQQASSYSAQNQGSATGITTQVGVKASVQPTSINSHHSLTPVQLEQLVSIAKDLQPSLEQARRAVSGTEALAAGVGSSVDVKVFKTLFPMQSDSRRDENAFNDKDDTVFSLLHGVLTSAQAVVPTLLERLATSNDELSRVQNQVNTSQNTVKGRPRSQTATSSKSVDSAMTAVNDEVDEDDEALGGKGTGAQSRTADKATLSKMGRIPKRSRAGSSATDAQDAKKRKTASKKR
ncbi:hypothetical protein ACM66B_001681 [Microbotryomycetes sp. NB124-2]